MAKYVKDKHGKFAGSIGDGKTQVPTAAPRIPGEDPSANNVTATEPFNLDASLAELTARWNANRTDPNKITVQDVNGFPRTVTFGTIDFDAVCLFTRGHCHSLALALHEATGHPIIAFRPVNPDRYDADGYLEAEDWDFSHDCTEYLDHENACQKCLYYEPEPRQSVTHFAIQTEPNTILDVTGSHALDTYAWQNSYEPLPVDGSNLHPLMYDPEVTGMYSASWLEPDINLGRHFVEAVYQLADTR
jgi:hypothetical protein